MKPSKVKLVVFVEPNTPIRDAATELIELARRLGASLIFEFGGKWWTVTGTDTPDDLVKALEEKAQELQTARWRPKPMPRKKP
jgi:hypothetical protein